MSEWAQDLFSLRSAGFSESEIAAESSSRRQNLIDGGFSPKETDDYFGVKEPDIGPLKRVIADNTKAYTQPNGPEGEPKPVENIAEAFGAGWGMNVNTLALKAIKGESLKQKRYVPPDAPWYYNVAQQAGTLIGDLPEMVAGAAAGGVAAGPVGAGAAAVAVPTAIRKSLMEFYDKGTIQDPADFLQRGSAVILDTAKSAVTGAATSLVGGQVGANLIEKGVMPLATKVLTSAAEVATMTTLGKAMEGEMPTAQDFVNGGILVAGMHVATAAPGKMMSIYGETGVKPEQVIQDAQADPVLRQELLSTREKIPAAYEPLVEKGADPGIKTPISGENTPIEAPPQTPKDLILSKVGEKAPTEKTPYSANEFYKDFVDRLDPIKQAVKELNGNTELLTSEDPYKLARMANDYKAKTRHFFEKGPIDFNTLEVTGPSFKDIIEPHKDDLNGLKSYMISKRALELEGRGIQSGFDTTAAEQVVKEGGKYEEAASKLNDFQNASLKYLKDSGVLSEKSFGAITKASENYVSFKRISEEGTTGGFSKKNPVKRIKGSDLSIQDPFMSMIENTELYTKLAERNRAVKALVDMADNTDGQTLFEKQKSTQRPIEVKAEEMQKAFDKAGIEADASSMTIFRKADHALAKDEFEVFRDGKREVYKTEPDVAEAIKVLDGNTLSQNIVVKAMRGITRAKRIGITFVPDFVIKNLFRDQITSGVFSGTTPFTEIASAMKSIMGEDERFWTFMKSGGASGAFLDNGEHYLKTLINEINPDLSLKEKVWNSATKPIHWLEFYGQLAEQGTRLAAASKAAGGATSGENIFKAGMEARESTVDFQRIGAKVSLFNGITAFMNANIQGVDRMGRALKEDPIQTMRRGAYITAFSTALWWLNRKDERVKELPQWEKDTFWPIGVDNWGPEKTPNEGDILPPYLVRKAADGTREINRGTVIRLPKPQELGLLFGTLPERILDMYFDKNPDAFEGFDKSMSNTLIPNYIPDSFAAPIEQFFNKSTFTDNKIVPTHIEGLLPNQQYTDYTTESAKALSKLIMPVPFIGSAGPKHQQLSSPMVIENYVRSWGGALGMYALQLADKGLEAAGINPEKNLPERTMSDIPILKSFIARFPLAGSNSVQKFQEIADDSDMVRKSVQALMQQGKVEEAMKLSQDSADKMADLSGPLRSIRTQEKEISKIYADPNMPKEQKRQLMEGLYYGIIETAKYGLTLHRDWKKQVEEQNLTKGH